MDRMGSIQYSQPKNIYVVSFLLKRVTPGTLQEVMSSPAEQRETYMHLNDHFNYSAPKIPHTSH